MQSVKMDTAVVLAGSCKISSCGGATTQMPRSTASRGTNFRESRKDACGCREGVVEEGDDDDVFLSDATDDTIDLNVSMAEDEAKKSCCKTICANSLPAAVVQSRKTLSHSKSCMLD